MNSPVGKLFLSIQQQISALVDGNGNKYFGLVDQDLGQLEAHNGDMRPPVGFPTPCVLIDIDNMDFKSLGANTQEGKGTISLRIGFPPFSSGSSITPILYREKALYYYDLEQFLHQAIQGTTPGAQEGYSSLLDIYGAYVRISAKTERRTDLIRVRQLTYSLGMTDDTTINLPIPAPVTPNITTTFAE